ncbi:MAG: 2-oxoacid:acceptor oxidoreductase family protein, partial [candidate division WOR-3 bacterium]|nr:2-oxoacid:acceptor oxidoreductase family protein [candidate division WOR-3 bacterium]
NVRPDRKDVTLIAVPANQIASDAGTGKAANMVMLGAYVGATGIVPFDAVVEMTKHEFARKAKLIPVNIQCLEAGYKLGQAGRG